MHSRRIRHLYHWRLDKSARERYASVSFIRFRGGLLQLRSRHGKTDLPVTVDALLGYLAPHRPGGALISVSGSAKRGSGKEWSASFRLLNSPRCVFHKNIPRPSALP